jgi:catechol 2,3-dioxygenase-like lactoylglutathione lyase family enzyme
MKRVTGIGGIFFKAKDPKALGAWYRDHLGVEVNDWNFASFEWGGDGSPSGQTLFTLFKADTDYLAPSKAPFMVNFRVDNRDALIAALKAEGCNVVDKTDDSEYGKFGWVIDPEGNKVELWEPPAGQ